MAAPISLNIIIVGGGIAGLSAAIALRRAGHTTKVFERSSFHNEVGAAINCCPNAVRILHSWDIDCNDAKMVRIGSTYTAEAGTLKEVSSDSWENSEQRYGAPWLLSHRHDLHALLHHAATRVDRPGTPARVLNKVKMSTYDPAKGTITLEDGIVHQADLVIAADGCHSLAVEHVVGYENPARPHGFSIFRFMIPTNTILQDPETAPMLEGEENKMKLFSIDDGTRRRFIWYPCRNGELQNFGALHPNNPKYGAIEDWHNVIDRSAFFEEFEGTMHPKLRKMFEKVTEFKLFKLMNREPLSTFFNGRLVIIGDAAHPMLPLQAQGGAQAIEDAAALGVMFQNLDSIDDEQIAERLQLFQDVRIQRASIMQIISNQAQDETEDGELEKAVRKFLPAHDGTIPSTPFAFADYNFGHDVVKESKKAFAEFESRRMREQFDPQVKTSQVGITT